MTAPPPTLETLVQQIGPFWGSPHPFESFNAYEDGRDAWSTVRPDRSGGMVVSIGNGPDVSIFVSEDIDSDKGFHLIRALRGCGVKTCAVYSAFCARRGQEVGYDNVTVHVGVYGQESIGRIRAAGAQIRGPDAAAPEASSGNDRPGGGPG
jgi:hypothetical protein